MTPNEFKNKIKQVQKHFEKIEDILNSLPEGLREEVLNYHNEEYTLQHCSRWGLQGSQEIAESSKYLHKKASENYDI